MIKKKIILQLSQWYCDCNMIHDFLLTEKNKSFVGVSVN